jgi:protein O-GlcNAc transferase
MNPGTHDPMQQTQPPPSEVNALLVLYNARRYAEAESRTRTLLEQYPQFGFGWKLLGGTQQMQGKDAQPAFQKVVELMPNDAEAHYNLGVILKSKGQLNQAATSYQRAITLKPEYAEAHSNLGNTLKDLGQLKDALASYRRALKLKPDSADTHNNLGTALKDLGQLNDALTSYRQAIALQPDFAWAHYNLGNAQKQLGQLDEALHSYRRAITLKPDFADAHNNLGAVLQALGQPDAALASFRRAEELQPQSLQHAIYTRLLLPVIPESPASIAEWRDRYQNGIAKLMDAAGTLDEPGDKLSGFSFYLAYHNANDRPLMEALCRLFRARVPEFNFTAPHVQLWRSPSERGQRIRIGFLSEFLNDHTIGKHYQGFIRHLDRKRFEVVVIHSSKSRRDAFRQKLDTLADKVLTLPAGLKNQQQAVAAEQLDVLFYPDIGMAPSTYFLAYARLAPVQATSWGHPDTTGLDSMDYYISAMSNEPESAEKNYTERLIRLNRLPCFYEQTPASSMPPLSKAELGLPESGTLYGCPQNLFKLHPDFDAVLAAIAAGDPTGYLILPEGKHAAWTELLKVRWAKTFPGLGERVIFLPRMSWERFMAMMAQMDVLLDPLHFGSGNTLYDAMLNGTPVVTWPGEFARGRNVAAAYRQMGVDDAPIAQHLGDYAPLALALGRDPERRQALRIASLEAAGRELFEDKQAVREFEAFLEAAVDAAGQGEVLATEWRAPSSA